MFSLRRIGGSHGTNADRSSPMPHHHFVVVVVLLVGDTRNSGAVTVKLMCGRDATDSDEQYE